MDFETVRPVIEKFVVLKETEPGYWQKIRMFSQEDKVWYLFNKNENLRSKEETPGIWRLEALELLTQKSEEEITDFFDAGMELLTDMFENNPQG